MADSVDQFADALRYPLMRAAPDPIEIMEILLKAIPHPILIKDRAHRWRLINEAMCDLLGLSRDAVLGRTDHDILPKAQADRRWDEDEKVFTTGSDHVAEERFVTSDGATRILHIHKRLATFVASPQPDAFLVISITDSVGPREADASPRNQEMHFQTMADGVPVIIWMTDAMGKTVAHNRYWEEATGQRRADALDFCTTPRFD